jgi:hypothetical protein
MKWHPELKGSLAASLDQQVVLLKRAYQKRGRETVIGTFRSAARGLAHTHPVTDLTADTLMGLYSPGELVDSVISGILDTEVPCLFKFSDRTPALFILVFRMDIGIEPQPGKSYTFVSKRFYRVEGAVCAADMDEDFHIYII